MIAATLPAEISDRLPANRQVAVPAQFSPIGDMEQQFKMAVRQRELLANYIKSQFDPSRHFYKVRDADKPSLTKEGAELVCLPHGLVPDYQIIGGLLDPPSDRNQRYQITVKCILRKRGEPDSFFGAGIGSASNYITKKSGEEIPRQRDPGLCHNSTLKMAEKSAYVSATLNATAASEFFTQDLDDSPDHDAATNGEPEQTQQSPSQPCPVCNGPTYDNRSENDAREKRGEKRRPDFKCRDKSCNGVIWDASPRVTDEQLDRLNQLMTEWQFTVATIKKMDPLEAGKAVLKRTIEHMAKAFRYLRIGADMDTTAVFKQLRESDANRVVTWLSKVTESAKQTGDSIGDQLESGFASEGAVPEIDDQSIPY